MIQMMILYHPFFPDMGWKILKSGFGTVIFSCLNSFCKSVDFLTFWPKLTEGPFLEVDHISFTLVIL